MKEIRRITYNWFSTEEYGPDFSEFEVGKVGVEKIEEHRPAGEGDRLWYEVTFDNGVMIKVFNINTVKYEDWSEK